MRARPKWDKADKVVVVAPTKSRGAPQPHAMAERADVKWLYEAARDGKLHIVEMQLKLHADPNAFQEPGVNEIKIKIKKGSLVFACDVLELCPDILSSCFGGGM